MSKMIKDMFELMMKDKTDERDVLFNLLVDLAPVDKLIYSVLELYEEYGNDSRIMMLVSIIENKIENKTGT